MSDIQPDPLDAFVARIEQQLAKNGFPDRSVSFPIEKMYESAAAKELSFNKVLEVLEARGILHQKTPEKVVFMSTAPEPAMPDPSAFAGLDPAMFAGMSREQLMAAAQNAMQQMGPEQLAKVQSMVAGMTPEQQAEMMEQAKKLGLF
jgi:hypothetical protein